MSMPAPPRLYACQSYVFNNVRSLSCPLPNPPEPDSPTLQPAPMKLRTQ